MTTEGWCLVIGAVPLRLRGARLMSMSSVDNHNLESREENASRQKDMRGVWVAFVFVSMIVCQIVRIVPRCLYLQPIVSISASPRI